MKYLLYGHGGSGNHGCEAIIRTTLNMIPEGSQIDVYSAQLERDKQYGITDKAVFHQNRVKKDSPFLYYLNKAIYRLTGYTDMLNRFTLGDAFKARNCVCMSVGGDNYCNGEPERHASRNRLFAKNNKTVLWGCSVSPELMDDPKYVRDMQRYSLITARESLTYNALVKAGVKNTRLVPDPAFTLETQETELPSVFSEMKVVGINISPLVMKYEKGADILIRNIENLIDYILSDTDYGIALIPHVLLKGNNDLTPLRQLFEKYKDSERICLIDGNDTLNCCQLKYIISKCSFMVVSRTHASIAAYSSSVPTLVLGYSVKSIGIAADIFGTPDHYVLPVDKITEPMEVKEAFRWLEVNEESIRKHYENMMPEYISKAYTAKEYLSEIR